MASLTSWEKQQIDSIHLLLDQAAEAVEYLKKYEEVLSADKGLSTERNTDEEQLKFRLIVFNLSSVLDYTYYLLYCHFSNKGQPDYSAKSMQCGFPFKAKGVKISDTPSHNMSEKFTREKLEFLWGSKIAAKGTHMWKDISQILLDVQPKLRVDDSGSPIEDSNPVIHLGNEESLSLLHFYRNCCTHRGLINFEKKGMIFEIDQATRAVSIVNKQNDRPGVFSFPVPKTAYWIQLPQHVLAHRPEEQQVPRMLLDVLQQLFDFARRISSQLLFSSFLIPRATVIILKKHFGESCPVDEVVKPISGIQQATVRITVDNPTKQERLPLSACYEHKEKLEAVDGACSHLLESLVKEGVYPVRPYKYMYSTRHGYKSHPPVQGLSPKTDDTLKHLNELRQRFGNAKLTLAWNDVGPVQVGSNEQCFEVKRTLVISDGDVKLLELQSGACRGIGKVEPVRVATKILIGELVRLGFVRINNS